ncbi:MAG: DUF5058 family protein [Treponema sp.]|nr:DUF5058 family protein [Treponema sp.]
MDHLVVANGGWMFFLAALVVIGIAVQSVLFIRKSWRRGTEIGIETEVMKKAMLNSAIFSIIPSLPILIFLMVFTVSFGKYFTWYRFSVVGSPVYENMAASMVAQHFGLSGITDPAFNLNIFAVAMWVLTAGIIWGIVFNIFFMKSLDKFSKKAKASNNTFVPVVSAALFIGMLSLLSTPHITNFKNPTAIVAFVSAAIMVVLCGKIAKVTKIKAIDEFSLPISLLVGMAMSILFTHIQQ